MKRTLMTLAILATLFVTVGAPGFGITGAGVAQASSYCGGVSDSLRAAGWVPAGCR